MAMPRFRGNGLKRVLSQKLIQASGGTSDGIVQPNHGESGYRLASGVGDSDPCGRLAKEISLVFFLQALIAQGIGRVDERVPSACLQMIAQRIARLDFGWHECIRNALSL